MNAPLRALALSCLLFGCTEPAETHDASRARLSVDAAATHAIEVDTPVVLRGLAIGDPDAHGRPTVVPCATCHGPEGARALPARAELVRGPHVGLRVEHGDLTCGSCHHEADRSALRLADGRAIPLVDAMRLCSQCHGTQARDYARGAHGGMRGYWDLTRGGRERNHCVSCHDPHGPRFGSFDPAPPPRDRFLPPPRRSAHD